MSKKRSNDIYKEPQILRSFADKMYRVVINRPDGTQLSISPGFKRVDGADANFSDMREWFANYTKANGAPPVRLKMKKKVAPTPPADPPPGEQA